MTKDVGEVQHLEFPYYPNFTYLDMALSASYTRRFHMVRVQREQNLSDHSYRVAAIWRVLFARWRYWWDVEADTPAVIQGLDLQLIELLGLKLCLDHDLAETLVGDLPSHSKSPATKAGLHEAEAQVLSMVTDRDVHLDHLLDPVLQHTPEWTVAKALLKLADIAEGLVFSYYNQGLGHNVQDPKWRWVNDNWVRIADRYCASLSESIYFSPEWCRGARDWIVVDRMGVAAQHA